MNCNNTIDIVNFINHCHCLPFKWTEVGVFGQGGLVAVPPVVRDR